MLSRRALSRALSRNPSRYGLSHASFLQIRSLTQTGINDPNMVQSSLIIHPDFNGLDSVLTDLRTAITPTPRPKSDNFETLMVTGGTSKIDGTLENPSMRTMIS